jgi:hypothetical protein
MWMHDDSCTDFFLLLLLFEKNTYLHTYVPTYLPAYLPNLPTFHRTPMDAAFLSRWTVSIASQEDPQQEVSLERKPGTYFGVDLSSAGKATWKSGRSWEKHGKTRGKPAGFATKK